MNFFKRLIAWIDGLFSSKPAPVAAPAPAPAPVTLDTASLAAIAGHVNVMTNVIRTDLAKRGTVAALPVAQPAAGPQEAVPVTVTPSPDGTSVVVSATAPAAYKPNPLSNTPDWRVFTDTSPGNFAVHYALVPDGKGGTAVMLDGSGHPIFNLLYDGHTFPNEAAIATYKSVVAATAPAAAARDAAAAAQVFNGPVPVGSLDDNDRMFLYWRAHQQPDGATWPYKTLAGTSLEIRQAINWVADGPGSGVMASFLPSTYVGKLRPYA